MAAEVELGVFETLKALEQFQIPPFETGYEGSAFNDLSGALMPGSGRSADHSETSLAGG
jgi:hypothetical protein